MYGHGDADYSEAREWYEKNMPQIFQKHAEAQWNLSLMYAGNLYYDGHGVKQDYSKAREWYEKAAKQEDADAQCNLGAMYANGHGVKQDYSKAREWCEKAAKQGQADAQFNMGVLYCGASACPSNLGVIYN